MKMNSSFFIFVFQWTTFSLSIVLLQIWMYLLHFMDELSGLLSFLSSVLLLKFKNGLQAFLKGTTNDLQAKYASALYPYLTINTCITPFKIRIIAHIVKMIFTGYSLIAKSILNKNKGYN